MSGTRYGFIAQEVLEVEGHTENMKLAEKSTVSKHYTEGIKSICSDNVMYKSQMSAKDCILISAIKELSAEVELLKQQ